MPNLLPPKARWLVARLLLLLLAGALAGPAAAQAPADTLRINNLLAAAQRLPPADTARHRAYLQEVVRLSQAAHYDFGLGVAYNALSVLAGRRGDNRRDSLYLVLARRTLEPLFRRRPEHRIGLTLAGIANNEAAHLQKVGNYQAATQAMLRTVSYLRRIGNHQVLVVIYYNLGGTFYILDQYDKALYYWKQGLALRPQAPEAKELVLLAANIAMHYNDNGDQPDSARHYLALARQLSDRGPGAELRDQYLKVQGQYDIRHGRVREGVARLDQALALARQHAYPGQVATLLPEVGRGHLALGEYARARAYLLESLRLAREAGDLEQTAVYEALSETEEKAGNYAQALRYYRRRTDLNDSLNNLNVKGQIADLETKYQARQKEQQISGLQQQQRLQAAELRRQHTLTYAALALAAALLAAGALGLVALRNRRRLEQQQQLLQAQKIQELEQERQLLATEAMLRGQEEERSRLARDLHDGLGGMLSTVKYYLGSVRGAMLLPEASAQLFNRSLEHLDSSISELRRVARDMMPEALVQFGLIPALRDVCDSAGQSQGMSVQLQAYGMEEERLPQRTEVVVYRLVQELLNNILKHAQARHVIVQLIRDGRHIQLVVEDDGKGFDTSKPRTGVGLRSIQARVDYLRGTLELHSAPGQGTTATIEFNLPKPETIRHKQFEEAAVA